MKKKSPTYYRKKLVARAKLEAKERDNFICQRCGKNGKAGYKIDGAHIYSEGKYNGMSALADNIIALCMQCHLWWHENPIQSADWYQKKFSDRYKILKKLSQKTLKINWKQVYEDSTN